MKDQEILQIFIDFAPFLAQVLGPGCEVVIHDAKDVDQSLIHIENPLSGRRVGEPLTEFAKNIMESCQDTQQYYLTNYKGYVHNNEFLDSTYFIRNEGRIIGFLCINKDMGEIKALNNALSALLRSFNLQMPQEASPSETLDGLVDSVMHERIAKAIENTGILPSRMNKQERMQVIATLKSSGVLNIKGSIAELSQQLGISVPTIYRYLKELEP